MRAAVWAVLGPFTCLFSKSYTLKSRIVWTRYGSGNKYKVWEVSNRLNLLGRSLLTRRIV
jgi:hypothetical protein